MNEVVTPNAPEVKIEPVKKSNKKIFIIIGAVLIFCALLTVGIVFALKTVTDKLALSNSQITVTPTITTDNTDFPTGPGSMDSQGLEIMKDPSIRYNFYDYELPTTHTAEFKSVNVTEPVANKVYLGKEPAYSNYLIWTCNNRGTCFQFEYSYSEGWTRNQYDKDGSSGTPTMEFKDLIGLKEIMTYESADYGFNIVDIQNSFDLNYLYLSVNFLGDTEEEDTSGIYRYDIKNGKFIDSFQYDLAMPFLPERQGAFNFPTPAVSVKGNYLVTTIGSCYACGGGPVSTLVLNWQDRSFKYIGEHTSNWNIVLSNKTISFTKMIDTGKSAVCVDFCPIFEEGEIVTTSLP